MKKLMIFLLCFLLTGCAVRRTPGWRFGELRVLRLRPFRLGLLPPGGGRVLSDARPGRLPGGELLSL